jgi:hypothetical protein
MLRTLAGYSQEALTQYAQVAQLVVQGTENPRGGG